MGAPTEIGLKVHLRPAEAKRELATVLDSVDGDVSRAAERLGVTRRTFDRWVVALDLRAHVIDGRTREKIGSGR